MNVKLDNYEISLGWDGPTLYVTCRRCRDAAVAHALFERPSSCAVGEMEPSIYPPWGDEDKVAQYREWLTRWEHWEIIGYETCPNDVAELIARIKTHEVMHHAMGDE